MGEIPAELCNLTTLRELYLGYFNSFIVEILSELGRLQVLVRLDLANCSISGCGRAQSRRPPPVREDQVCWKKM
jgi:hypothetical protein